MKPIYLEMQAFGPYVEKQVINFDDLKGDGIFLIKGKTGSGKTTIFDAMMYALYGESSGSYVKTHSARNKIEELRCNQAPFELETYVKFVFEIKYKKYYFKRSLVPKKINFSKEYEAGTIDSEGNCVPFFNNPKQEDINNKAQELIGFDKDQFRQVVLLPQGQFEQFLTANTDDKTRILNSIFKTEKWGDYTTNFREKASEALKVLNEEKQKIDIILGEQDMTTIDELRYKIKDLKKDKKIAEEDWERYNFDEKQKKLNEDIKLTEQFKVLHELEKECDKLKKDEQEINELKTKYEQYSKAAKLRNIYDNYEKAKEQLSQRSDFVTKINADLPEVLNKMQEAQKAKEKHEQLEIVENSRKDIAEYNSKKHLYESYSKVQAKLNEVTAELINKEQAYKSVEQEYIEAKVRAAELNREFESADQEARDVRKKYYSGIYGAIASEIKENEPCPVCGSMVHPNLAITGADCVTKTEMESKEEKAQQLNDRFKQADSERSSKEEEKNLKYQELCDSKQRKEIASSELTNVKNGLIDGIEDIAQLNDKIASCQKDIKDYDDKLNELQQAFENAQKEYTKLQTTIENAKKEETAAQSAHDTVKGSLEEALSRENYSSIDDLKQFIVSDEKLKEMNERLINYEINQKNNETKLNSKKEELQGIEEPDSAKIEERQKDLNRTKENHIIKLERINNLIKVLESKEDEVSDMYEHYQKEIVTAQANMQFADKLHGNNGMGIQQYVLAIMFNQVISEANRMLLKVHGGRYSLFRTEDKEGRGKGGFELKVHDNRCPEQEGRFVSLLSGGEKFLVSLALSIGLSTIAQKSGVQVGTLFIDEGFGTLDENSINDALDVLQFVREGDIMIGIISHVQVLEEHIPAQIEVIKSEQGSHIKVKSN